MEALDVSAGEDRWNQVEENPGKFWIFSCRISVITVIIIAIIIITITIINVIIITLILFYPFVFGFSSVFVVVYFYCYVLYLCCYADIVTVGPAH
jgi:hypothetical protein